MEYKALARKARARLLQMHYESGVGHIGGNLSVLDVLLVLHHEIMEEKDVCVLSKGHAAGALYITLWAHGLINDDQLRTFHGDASKMAGHPAPRWHDGIPIATGSLGHGLPVAAGMALGRKMKNDPARVFCVMSDGEWEEGSNWEALIFIAHHGLDNLTVLVDANGLQGFGSTDGVASLEPLREKIAVHGFSVMEVDGHDSAAMIDAVNAPTSKPKVVILRTVKGRGVPFMEGKMEWHYLPMNKAQYEEALEAVGQA